MSDATSPSANRGLLKIDISGATAIGKTVIGILIAEALAKVFEANDVLVPISVVNLDGDWSLRREQATMAAEASARLHLPRLQRVLIVDLNAPAQWVDYQAAGLEDIACMDTDGEYFTEITPDTYVGPALPESSESPSETPALKTEEISLADELRTITTHQASPLDNDLTISVLDERGPGNANHNYIVENARGVICNVHFQNGPIKEAGVNGVSNEALLAIVDDRLDGFQSGPYACDDNAEARAHILAAIACLQRRTKRRLERGVEGTSTI